MPGVVEPIILVFDIGGTFMRAGLYDAGSGTVRRIRRSETSRGGDTLYDAMAGLGSAVLEGSSPSIVAVAFPGPIDCAGRVLAAPTLWGRPSIPPIPVGKHAQSLWPAARVHLLNDVTAAGYRYVSESPDPFCIVTVSSGIGHKVFVDGHPLVGRNGRGGELGHWRVDDSETAPWCDCGSQGHLGAVASGRATGFQLRALAAESSAAFRGSALAGSGASIDRIDNEAIARAFRDGDAWTARLVGRMARPLGTALAAIHLAVGVERFVVIGGFALSLGQGYRAALVESAAAASWDLGQGWDGMIRLGEADEEAALIGAGHCAVHGVGSVERPPQGRG